MKQFKTFALSLAVSGLVCLLIWALAHSLSISKTPIQHPSPTGQYLSAYIGEPIQHNKPDLTWRKISHTDGAWLDDKGKALSPELFSAEHTLLLVQGHGPSMALKLHRFLDKNDLYKKTTVISPADGFIKDMRYHNPDVAANYGQAFLIRLQALERLRLSGFLIFDKDIAWLDRELFSKETISQLIQFFKGKGIPVIIGPVDKEVPSQWQADTIRLTTS